MKWRIGKFFGVSYYIKPEVLLVTILLLIGNDNQKGLGRILSYVLLISLHELGHMVFGLARDCRTKAIVVGISGGFCEYREIKTGRDSMILSWGGVAFQFVLFMIVMCVYLVGYWPSEPFFEHSFDVLTVGNILMIIYNLLPFKGLDGEETWSFLKKKRSRNPSS